MLRTVVASYDDIAATLHLDHGKTVDDCVRAMDHGFTSVMIDGSRSAGDEPNDFASNVAVTAQVVGLAHARGVSVEGELGTIGGAEAGLSGVLEEIVYADPVQSEAFVEQTGVDALAVAVGTRVRTRTSTGRPRYGPTWPRIPPWPTPPAGSRRPVRRCGPSSLSGCGSSGPLVADSSLST